MCKPVIASRVGGVPEIILENETGWTINNEATDKWVSTIRMVMEDQKLGRGMGARGRAWVADNFGWKAIAAQVERILIREANSSQT